MKQENSQWYYKPLCVAFPVPFWSDYNLQQVTLITIVLTLETGNFIYEAKFSSSLFYPKYLPCLGVVGALGDYSKFADDPSFGLKRAVIPPSCQRQPNGAIWWVLRKEAIPWFLTCNCNKKDLILKLGIKGHSSGFEI